MTDEGLRVDGTSVFLAAPLGSDIWKGNEDLSWGLREPKGALVEGHREPKPCGRLPPRVMPVERRVTPQKSETPQSLEHAVCPHAPFVCPRAPGKGTHRSPGAGKPLELTSWRGRTALG